MVSIFHGYNFTFLWLTTFISWISVCFEPILFLTMDQTYIFVVNRFHESDLPKCPLSIDLVLERVDQFLDGHSGPRLAIQSRAEQRRRLNHAHNICGFAHDVCGCCSRDKYTTAHTQGGGGGG